jgi:GNAT superfamily N-acetyltransferase
MGESLLMDRAIFVTKTPGYCSAYIYTEDLSLRAVAEANLVGTDWWVSRVLVQPPNARGKGLGGRLLEKLKRAERDTGGTRLLVTPGGYSNEWERQDKFYRAHGFRDADPTKDYGLLEVDLTESEDATQRHD